MSTKSLLKALAFATFSEKLAGDARRGQICAFSYRPVGCGERLHQKPTPSDPAAKLPRTMFLGIDDPERRTLEIRRQDCIVCARGASQQTDVVLERILRFDTVSDKRTVPDRIECDILAYRRVILFMHGETPTATVDDARRTYRH